MTTRLQHAVRRAAPARRHTLVARASLGTYVLACACATPIANVGGDAIKRPSVEAFPTSWFGTYRGECQTLGDSAVRSRFAMQLQIAPRNDGRIAWQITYGTGDAAQLRDYDLVPVAAELGHFAIDENNGIVLDCYLRGNAVYSSFEVGTVRLLARYGRRGDAIECEIITQSGSPARVSTVTSATTEQQVTAWPIRNVQRGVLRKVPKD